MTTIRFSQQWNGFHHSHRQTLETALEQFLMDEGRYDCFISLNYVLAELAGNADKANLKRAHFEREGLDPLVSEQYDRGMAGFKEAVSTHPDELVSILEGRGGSVKVWFGKQDTDLVFGVFNDSPLLEVEEQRFKEKIRVAQKFATIQEVMAGDLDQSEGGGLGLIITVLMLRKIDLDETHLQLSSTSEGTTALLVVPPRAGQAKEILAQSVVDAIDDIPQIPDHIVEIMRLLEDPTKSFIHIVPIVRGDPNLIAALLKAANSSRYSFPRRVETIAEAVGVMGLPAIQELLISVTAEKLLSHRYQLDAVQKVIDHATEVAWYCGELLKAAGSTSAIASVFVCAMLHDFGEIVVNALIPGLTEKITELCRAKGWNTFSLETLTSGFNHSLVGAALAKKWQFPDKIVETIEFHHLPMEASYHCRETVALVYLADFLWLRARNLIEWDDLIDEVLETFPRKTPKEWLEIFKSILEKKKPFPVPVPLS